MNDRLPDLSGKQNSAYRRASIAEPRRSFKTFRRLVLTMANRKGVFIGAYVPNELKESLRRRAALEHRTLSQEITLRNPKDVSLAKRLNKSSKSGNVR